MKKYGFSKKERLISPGQFKKVYQDSQLIKNAFIWLYRRSNGVSFSRLGISVNKKLCSSIVRRNRAKRLIRQVYQVNKQKFGTGQDFVVVVKKLPEKKLEYCFFEKNLLMICKKCLKK